MTKRFIALALSLTCTIAFASCGDSSDSSVKVTPKNTVTEEKKPTEEITTESFSNLIEKNSSKILSNYDGVLAYISDDGKLYMWGDNVRGLIANETEDYVPSPVKIMDNVASFDFSYENCIVLTNDGVLYTWGDNNCGQLGNGTTDDSRIPVRIMDNVASFNFKGAVCATITKNNDLYMWGTSYDGILGNGSISSYVPTKIMDNVASINIGNGGSAAIKKDGSLYMWGNEKIKTPVKTMDNVVSVEQFDVDSYNHYITLAITKDGRLLKWNNEDNKDNIVFEKILDNVDSVYDGALHFAAITKDGCLYSWGDNEYGELGNGTDINSDTPVKVLDNVATVNYLKHDGSAALTKDGDLYMWGCYSDSNVPVKVLENVYSFDIAKSHIAALTNDGELYTWGANNYGQLGNGGNRKSKEPIMIMENVFQVCLWFRGSAAITADGSVYAWGESPYNYRRDDKNDKPELDSNVPVKVNIPQ